jgi:ribonuclease D
MFKGVYEEKKSSLQYMTEKILDKELCKFNQTSDWGMRPLRKAQLHYAILDSVCLVEVYKKISAEAIKGG